MGFIPPHFSAKIPSTYVSSLSRVYEFRTAGAKPHVSFSTCFEAARGSLMDRYRCAFDIWETLECEMGRRIEEFVWIYTTSLHRQTCRLCPGRMKTTPNKQDATWNHRMAILVPAKLLHIEAFSAISVVEELLNSENGNNSNKVRWLYTVPDIPSRIEFHVTCERRKTFRTASVEPFGTSKVIFKAKREVHIILYNDLFGIARSSKEVWGRMLDGVDRRIL